MSLPLRITFEDKDYTYKVLTKSIDKETKEIKIDLSGEEFTFVLNEANEWVANEMSVGDD